MTADLNTDIDDASEDDEATSAADPETCAEREALARQYKVDPDGALRLDKWLWAARLFKTRALAAEEIGRHRIQVNGQPVAKASREVRAGDRLQLRQGDCPTPRELTVTAVSLIRGPAPAARLLYRETPESVKAQAEWRAQRSYRADPATAIEHGRPTKAARRQLAEWQRWSVSIDDR